MREMFAIFWKKIYSKQLVTVLLVMKLFILYFQYVFLRQRIYTILVGNQPRHANVCPRGSLHVGLLRSNSISVIITSSYKSPKERKSRCIVQCTLKTKISRIEKAEASFNILYRKMSIGNKM